MNDKLPKLKLNWIKTDFMDGKYPIWFVHLPGYDTEDSICTRVEFEIVHKEWVVSIGHIIYRKAGDLSEELEVKQFAEQMLREYIQNLQNLFKRKIKKDEK